MQIGCLSRRAIGVFDPMKGAICFKRYLRTGAADAATYASGFLAARLRARGFSAEAAALKAAAVPLLEIGQTWGHNQGIALGDEKEMWSACLNLSVIPHVAFRFDFLSTDMPPVEESLFEVRDESTPDYCTSIKKTFGDPFFIFLEHGVIGVLPEYGSAATWPEASFSTAKIWEGRKAFQDDMSYEGQKVPAFMAIQNTGLWKDESPTSHWLRQAGVSDAPKPWLVSLLTYLKIDPTQWQRCARKAVGIA